MRLHEHEADSRRSHMARRPCPAPGDGGAVGVMAWYALVIGPALASVGYLVWEFWTAPLMDEDADL